MPLDISHQEIDPYAPPQSDISIEAAPRSQWIAKEGKYLVIPNQSMDLTQYCRYCGAISHGHLIEQKLRYVPKKYKIFTDSPSAILYGSILCIIFLSAFGDSFAFFCVFLILVFFVWEIIRHIVQKKILVTLSECLYHRTQRVIMTISAYLCILLFFMSLSTISIQGMSWIFASLALVLFVILNYRQRLRIVKNSELMLWLGGFSVKFRQHYADFSSIIF